MASERAEPSAADLMMESGGRVERVALIDRFDAVLGNDATGTKGREAPPRPVTDAVVDAATVTENGVESATRTADEDARVAVDDNGNGDGVTAGDSGSPPSRTSAAAAPAVDGSETTTSSDDRVNGNPTRAHRPTEPVDNDDPRRPVGGCGVAAPAASTHGQVATTGTGTTTTTTFAGAEVKMRDRRRRESAPAIGTEPDHHHHAAGHHAQVRGGGRRISRGSQRAMLTGGLSEDGGGGGGWEGADAAGDGSTPKGSRRNFIELMMSSSPQVRRSMIHRGSCLRDSVKSDGDSASLLSSSATDEDCCASVALDPLEHEWMLCASDGQWDSLHPLLTVEPGLVSKRDFVTGFTCLHWAAKQGKAELLGRLLVFARDSAVAVDVNCRSCSGYTPLHLAAMHCHTQVVRTLVSDWEADPEVRDYSGKRAIQYLPPPLAADLHHEGVVVVTSPTGAAETDAGNTDRGGGRGRGWRIPRVLQSGNLNPLRLLNPPAEATEADAGGSSKPKASVLQRKSSLGRLNARLHRGRRRAQIIHSPSFRESGEVRGDEPLCSPVRTRPLSSLFG